MKISHVVAFDENLGIGKDNKLIWHLPADLKHFKELTMGHHMLMGRKTWESIGRPLPGRTSIVVTSDKDYKAEGAQVVNSIEEGIELAKGDSEICIIGGAEIFKQTMDIATHLHVTVVQEIFDADVFYPEIDLTKWKKVSSESFEGDEKNTIPYTFEEYERV